VASLERVIKFLSFVLAPPVCVYCKKKLLKRSHFCSDCFTKISPIVSYDLSLTLTKKIKVHALSGYNELLRPLVLAKRSKKVEGSYILADLIWKNTDFFQLPCDVLVPVPLHWTRRMQRGFNQAEEIAKFLAKKKGVNRVNLVTRVTQTIYQADLPIKLRADNVKDAFVLSESIDPLWFKGKHIVLIDDLMTTGNTLKYVARALLHLKPASITAFVACRAM
jgi:ComF family protein